MPGVFSRFVRIRSRKKRPSSSSNQYGTVWKTVRSAPSMSRIRSGREVAPEVEERDLVERPLRAGEAVELRLDGREVDVEVGLPDDGVGAPRVAVRDVAGGERGGREESEGESGGAGRDGLHRYRLQSKRNLTRADQTFTRLGGAAVAGGRTSTRVGMSMPTPSWTRRLVAWCAEKSRKGRYSTTGMSRSIDRQRDRDPGPGLARPGQHRVLSPGVAVERGPQLAAEDELEAPDPGRHARLGADDSAVRRADRHSLEEGGRGEGEDGGGDDQVPREEPERDAHPRGDPLACRDAGKSSVNAALPQAAPGARLPARGPW